MSEGERFLSFSVRCIGLFSFQVSLGTPANWQPEPHMGRKDLAGHQE